MDGKLFPSYSFGYTFLSNAKKVFESLPVVCRTCQQHEGVQGCHVLMVSSRSRSVAEDPDAWAARMTENQFSALSQHLNLTVLSEELRGLPHFLQFEKCKQFREEGVKVWCYNGWNTEHLLNLTRELVTKDMLSCAIQWAFPQAYYSVFAVALAYFKTAGLTEMSHAAVLTKLCGLMREGKYPARMSFLADGLKPFDFVQIAKFPAPSTLHYNEADGESVQTQIAQFLSATRSLDLKKHKVKVRFECKRKSKRKKSISRQEWLKVSQSLGPTSVFNLLYRKRIKANYQEIGTLQSEEINGDELIAKLGRMVAALNFVNEAFIAKAIGMQGYCALVGGSKHKAAAVRRVPLIKHVLRGS